MTIEHWLSPTIMRPLGWALLHFLWQGTALAALAAVGMALCRKASIRYMVGVVALVLMVAAPVPTFWFYWNADIVPALTTVPVPTTMQRQAPEPDSQLSSVPLGIAPDVFPMLVEIWLAGVLLFTLRCAGGVLLLERLRRRRTLPVNTQLLEIFMRLQQRIRLSRFVRYCECTWLEAPAVIGWFRPIILVPMTALTGLSGDQLEAVIAHELAHIKRLDAFVNAFQIAAETVLFYHPAVWWLSRRIRAERENACDDVAVVLCGNAVEYARALTLMAEWRSAPGLVMAANRGSLSARIGRLLGVAHLGSGVRGLGVTASLLCLATALFAGAVIAPLARPSVTSQNTPPATAAASPLIDTAAQPVTASKPPTATKRASVTMCRRSALRAAAATAVAENHPLARSRPAN